MWSLKRSFKTSKQQDRAAARGGTLFELTRDEAAAVSGGAIQVTYTPQNADGSLPKKPSK